MTTVTTLRPLHFWPETKSHGAGVVPAYVSCHGEPFVLPADTRCVTLLEGPCNRFLAKVEDRQAFRILDRGEYKEVA